MSTCRGCWGDESVPHGPGLVMVHVPEQADPMVLHQWPERCTLGEAPHRMSECGEFDPPRPEFRP